MFSPKRGSQGGRQACTATMPEKCWLALWVKAPWALSIWKKLVGVRLFSPGLKLQLISHSTFKAVNPTSQELLLGFAHCFPVPSLPINFHANWPRDPGQRMGPVRPAWQSPSCNVGVWLAAKSNPSRLLLGVFPELLPATRKAGPFQKDTAGDQRWLRSSPLSRTSIIRGRLWPARPRPPRNHTTHQPSLTGHIPSDLPCMQKKCTRCSSFYQEATETQRGEVGT